MGYDPESGYRGSFGCSGRIGRERDEFVTKTKHSNQETSPAGKERPAGRLSTTHIYNN